MPSLNNTINVLIVRGVQRMHQVYQSHPELSAGLRDELHGNLQEMFYSAQNVLRSLADIDQHSSYINVDRLRHYIRLARQYCSYRSRLGVIRPPVTLVREDLLFFLGVNCA